MLLSCCWMVSYFICIMKFMAAEEISLNQMVIFDVMQMGS